MNIKESAQTHLANFIFEYISSNKELSDTFNSNSRYKKEFFIGSVILFFAIDDILFNCDPFYKNHIVQYGQEYVVIKTKDKYVKINASLDISPISDSDISFYFVEPKEQTIVVYEKINEE